MSVLSKDRVREIFIAHGFTVKDGQTDLKPYVYAAAEALAEAAVRAEREGQGYWVDVDGVRIPRFGASLSVGATVPETDPRYLHLLDLLGAKDHEDAARIIAGHHARELLHHQLDVRSPVVREFMNAMRDQRESDEKNFHGYSLTRQVCAGLMAIGCFVPTADGDGGKAGDHSIQHAPQCSSQTLMLTCNPPRPAPCDCGAAPNPETKT